MMPRHSTDDNPTEHEISVLQHLSALAAHTTASSICHQLISSEGEFIDTRFPGNSPGARLQRGPSRRLGFATKPDISASMR
jgi:hypothetical protein